MLPTVDAYFVLAATADWEKQRRRRGRDLLQETKVIQRLVEGEEVPGGLVFPADGCRIGALILPNPIV